MKIVKLPPPPIQRVTNTRIKIIFFGYKKKISSQCRFSACHKFRMFFFFKARGVYYDVLPMPEIRHWPYILLPSPPSTCSQFNFPSYKPSRRKNSFSDINFLISFIYFFFRGMIKTHFQKDLMKRCGIILYLLFCNIIIY